MKIFSKKTRKLSVAVIFLLLMAILIGSVFYHVSYIAVQPDRFAFDGSLLLSDYDFTSAERPVLLAGDWELFFNELIPPDEIAGHDGGELISVPGSWTDNGHPRFGYATYRLRILLGENAPSQLSLKITPMGHSSMVWINGDLVYNSGQVGTTAKSSVPKLTSDIVTFWNDDANTVEIVIWVSNFTYYKSGVNYFMELGAPSTVMRTNIFRFLMAALILGGMLFVGLYSLVLFYFRNKEHANLFFGLLCICYFTRFTLGMVEIDSYFFSGLNEFIKVRGSVGSLVLISYFSVKLNMDILTLKKNFFIRSLLVATLAFAAASLLLPMPYTYILYNASKIIAASSALYLISHMLINFDRFKNSVLLFYFVGFIIYGALILFEAAGYNRLFFPSMTSSLALILSQAVVIAYNYSGAFERLEKSNIILEETVAERTEDLRRSHEATKELISNISHDLRTPITAVRGYMELLLSRGTLEETEKAYVESAYVRAGQLERLIKDLFFLTRITVKKLSLNIEEIDAGEFLAECLEGFRAEADLKGIELSLDMARVHSLKVRGDRVRLTQIIDNLLQNALFYAKNHVSINAGTKDGRPYISVCDDGEGISADDLPFIFDRLYKKRKDGTGLGLSIVKELAAMMGGTVFAESRPFEETELGVLLMFAEPDAERTQ